MLEYFTDANPLRADDFALPADGPRSRGGYKDDAEREAALLKRRRLRAEEESDRDD